MTKTLKAVFFGTPAFAAEILKFLLENKVNIAAVVTKPDKPRGRSGSLSPTPVKEVALLNDLPLFQPEIVSDPEFAPTLEQFQADLFIVVAYGEILKQPLLDKPKKACINLHASLLPKYRGAAPIQHSLLAGDLETGVTVMHMVKKMDAGDMIHRVKVEIPTDMTYGELENELCKAGKVALLKVLEDFELGIDLRIPQDPSQATMAPKIELENCEINWQRSSKDLHNLIRGVNPQPGAWCTAKVKDRLLRLKVYKSAVEECNEEYKKGEPAEILHWGKGGILVACGQGVLRLLEVQLEGKKLLSAEDFARGLPQEFFQFKTP